MAPAGCPPPVGPQGRSGPRLRCAAPLVLASLRDGLRPPLTAAHRRAIGHSTSRWQTIGSQSQPAHQSWRVPSTRPRVPRARHATDRISAFGREKMALSVKALLTSRAPSLMGLGRVKRASAFLLFFPFQGTVLGCAGASGRSRCQLGAPAAKRGRTRLMPARAGA